MNPNEWAYYETKVCILVKMIGKEYMSVLKSPVTTAADIILIFFLTKIMLDILYESSVGKTIHMD